MQIGFGRGCFTIPPDAAFDNVVTVDATGRAESLQLLLTWEPSSQLTEVLVVTLVAIGENETHEIASIASTPPLLFTVDTPFDLAPGWTHEIRVETSQLALGGAGEAYAAVEQSFTLMGALKMAPAQG